ncbi:flavoprotein wrbA-like [Hibiscus syriacus]|uniref:Flavoprotein wrbA-like n=1 Tax=Hibiscus syriacus TaxID=106335 RepID=A0A6A2XLB1_HIBSY|nr:flavoprotein wrbA-like [Hibiscus syriacus]
MDMEFLGSELNELCMRPSRGRPGRRRHGNNDDNFVSKNLHAERKRRKKLSDRLLALRSLMNKATIIEDAITYIQELKKTSDDLSEELLEMEASSEGGKQMEMEADAAAEMEKCGIKEEVKVTYIDGNTLLIKIILQKKRGCFTRLIETMDYLGFEHSETSVTTFKGAMLFSSCVHGKFVDALMVEQTELLLLEMIRTMNGNTC